MILPREEICPAVHLLASKPHGTLYIGVTGSLCNRIAAHKDASVPGFTRKYNVKMLVWFELHDTMESAIKREKQLKEWRRRWKIELLEKKNPIWRDLYGEVCNMPIQSGESPGNI